MENISTTLLASRVTTITSYTPLQTFKLDNSLSITSLKDRINNLIFVYGNWSAFQEKFHLNINYPQDNCLVLITQSDNLSDEMGENDKNFLVFKTTSLEMIDANVIMMAIELNLPLVYFPFSDNGDEFSQFRSEVACNNDAIFAELDFDNETTSKLDSFLIPLDGDLFSTMIVFNSNSPFMFESIMVLCKIKKIPKKIERERRILYFSTIPETYTERKNKMVIMSLLGWPAEFNNLIMDLKITNCEIFYEIIASLEEVIYGDNLRNYLISHKDIYGSYSFKYYGEFYEHAFDYLVELKRITNFTTNEWAYDYCATIKEVCLPILNQLFAVLESEFKEFCFDSLDIFEFKICMKRIVIDKTTKRLFSFAGHQLTTISLNILKSKENSLMIFNNMHMFDSNIGYVCFDADVSGEVDHTTEKKFYYFFDLAEAQKSNPLCLSINKSSFIKTLDDIKFMVAFEKSVYYMNEKNQLIRVAVGQNTGYVVTNILHNIVAFYIQDKLLNIVTKEETIVLDIMTNVVNVYGSYMSIFENPCIDVLGFNQDIAKFLVLERKETVGSPTTYSFGYASDHEIELRFSLVYNKNYSLKFYFTDNNNVVLMYGPKYYYLNVVGYSPNDVILSDLEKKFHVMTSDFNSGLNSWFEIVKLVFKKFIFPRNVNMFLDEVTENLSFFNNAKENLAEFGLHDRVSFNKIDDVYTQNVDKSALINQLVKISPIQLFTFCDNNILPLVFNITCGGGEKFYNEINNLIIHNICDHFFKNIQLNECNIVGIIGQQSGGKSYLLNRMFNCMFDVAAQRCTDGGWLSLSLDPHTNKWNIVIDCEGLFSSVRTIEEESKMIAFLTMFCDHLIINTSVSNNRGYFELFKRVALMVKTSFENTHTRRACANFVIRDLKQDESFMPIKELVDTLAVNKEYIKVLFSLTRIYSLPSFKDANFSICVDKFRQSIDQTKNEKNKKISSDISTFLPTLLAKIYVNDNEDIEKRLEEQILKKEQDEIKEIILTGSFDKGWISLKEESAEMRKNFFLKYFVSQFERLPTVKDYFHFENDQDITKFDIFIQDDINTRLNYAINRYGEFLDKTKLKISTKDSYFNSFKQKLFTVSKFLLCKEICRKCSRKCMRFAADHSGDCDCQTDHKCRNSCDVCIGKDFQCSFKFGPHDQHLCSIDDHFCEAMCSKCLNRCKLMKGHDGADNCKDRHLCEYQCNVDGCNRMCVINSDDPHDVHKCNLIICNSKCSFKNCNALCCYPDHFHLHDKTKNYIAPDHWFEGKVDYHICDTHEHVCEFECNKPSVVCMIDYEKIEKTTAYGTKYAYINQIHKRDVCCIPVPKYLKFHEENSKHHCFRLNHKCNKQCPDCLVFCELDSDVCTSLHFASIHRNKDQTDYFVSNSSHVKTITDTNGELLTNKLNSKSIYETCSSSCNKNGRGHLHIFENVNEFVNSKMVIIGEDKLKPCLSCKEKDFKILIMDCGIVCLSNFYKCSGCNIPIHVKCLGTHTFYCPECFSNQSVDKKNTDVEFMFFLAEHYPLFFEKKWPEMLDSSNQLVCGIPCVEYFEILNWKSPCDNVDVGLCSFSCDHFIHRVDSSDVDVYCSKFIGHDGDHQFKCKHETITKHQIAFVCDATGSMSSYIEGCRELIMKIVDKSNEGVSLIYEFSIVFYRDHPPQESTFVTEGSGNFRRFNIKLESYIKSMSAEGGGDYPEAVLDGIDQAIKLNWDMSTSTKKTMVWVGDAPPHGDMYHPGSKACPCKLVLTDLVKDIKLKHIQLMMVKLTALKLMEKEFVRTFKEYNIPKQLKVYDIDNSTTFVSILFESLIVDENINRNSTKLCKENLINIKKNLMLRVDVMTKDEEEEKSDSEDKDSDEKDSDEKDRDEKDSEEEKMDDTEEKDKKKSDDDEEEKMDDTEEKDKRKSDDDKEKKKKKSDDDEEKKKKKKKSDDDEEEKKSDDDEEKKKKSDDDDKLFRMELRKRIIMDMIGVARTLK